MIWLDPGHGDNDPGCKTADGRYREAELVMQLAEQIKALAPDRYAISRIRSQRPKFFDRAMGAKKINAKFALVMHFNSAENPLVNRTEWYAMSGLPMPWKFPELPLVLPVKQIPITDGEKFYPRVLTCLKYYKALNIPAVLLETAYLDREVTKVWLASGGIGHLADTLHGWLSSLGT